MSQGLLEGKVAVVTGAGAGLGRAYAEGLARAGAAVVVNDLDETRASEVSAGITGEGGSAVAEVAAVGSLDAAQQLVDRAVAEFGRLDLMVTNAGILRDRTIAKMTEDDFDAVIHTHLRGTFTCAKAAFERFREQGDGGRILMIGSPAGQFASFGQTNYSAAKSGIVGMARTLAVEGAKAGITVNAVVPVALTEMTATIPRFTDVYRAMLDGEPIPPEVRAGGMGTTADVAELIVFLASDAAAEITGQVFGVGGDKVSIWSHPREVAVSLREGGWTAEALRDSFETEFAPHLQAYTRQPAVTR